METEIEAKWLNIDKFAMRQALQRVGARLVAPERAMVRQTFDLGTRFEGTGSWARVRDEAGKVTMSFKQLQDRSLYGTKEITLVVDNYDNACRFLAAIGLTSISIQETRRESWELDGAAIEIDTWPWIPSFIEIEAKNEHELRRIAKLLDLDFAAALHGSVETAYQAVYNVTEREVDSWPEIRFSEVPDWLRAKKR